MQAAPLRTHSKFPHLKKKMGDHYPSAPESTKYLRKAPWYLALQVPNTIRSHLVEDQYEETNRDDHVSESDYDGGNMMDDTLADAFEDPPMFEDEEDDNSVKLFFQEYRTKFETVQVVTDEVINHCDFHTETPQPFDLSLVSTP
ncbi:unnamed protein product [Cuscuta epithymum]|uniref:Uncharacterized protein n=1 Tax=Cuscuta epithymum TaxID=186058 RepID=A0AAV0CTP7_9ASTE|nr:unnamed protein product [Cuscuta epithymum]